MARLRSAVNKAKGAGASLAANIGESSSKLLASAASTPFARKSRSTKTGTSTHKSKVPLPKTPSRVISYPSLEKIASETAPDLLPIITPRPTTASSIPSPAPKSVKRILTERENEPVQSMPGAFDASPVKSLTFDFETVKERLGFGITDREKTKERLGGKLEKGKAFINNLKAVASAPLPAPSTPARPKTAVGTAATTGKRQRFDDVHEKVFSKMDSIANHYAARRTPKTAVSTPQNPQKGLKRTKSQTKIDDTSSIPSPSPQKKKQPENDDLLRSKKRRVDFGPPPALSATSMKGRRLSAAAQRAATARRNISGSRKPLPALPRTGTQPSIRVVADSPRPSLIPTTPSQRERHNIAPATVGPSRLVFPAVPTHDPSTSPKKPVSPAKAALTDFTFKARAAGHASFQKLETLHTHVSNLAKKKNEGPTFTESKELEDPFAAPTLKTFNLVGSPSKVVGDFISSRKRREPDAEPLERVQKRIRFDAEEVMAKGKQAVKDAFDAEDMMAKGRQARQAVKNQIDALATPKRRAVVTRTVKDEDSTLSVKATRAKPKWR